MQKKSLSYLLPLLLLISCGEETLSKKTNSSDFVAPGINTFSLNTCALSHLEKPPVDILFIVDNSGSANNDQFNALKNNISKTLQNISNDFDYHILVAPLLASSGEHIQSYPVLFNNPSSLDIANVNASSIENVNVFSPVIGNNAEFGFDRAVSLINGNRSNGVFRQNSNLVVVLISSEDDDSVFRSYSGNFVFDQNLYNEKFNSLKSLTQKYASTNSVSNPLNAQSFRFITFVPFSNCNNFRAGVNYSKMSRDIYQFMTYSDDSASNTYNLCNGNYTNLFTSVNNSIKAIIVGHAYDHWKISNASEASIQTDDITVTKILANGSKISIPASNTNGFEYMGYATNQNTRYLPTPGEPQSGLMIRLNGTARVSYPECIIAKTRSPTEYFGYVAITQNPDLSTVKMTIDGTNIPQDNTNGWSFIGYLDIQNIKVPGPTSASVLPALNKSGYFFKLNGNAIYTNGQTVEVYFKPASR